VNAGLNKNKRTAKNDKTDIENSELPDNDAYVVIPNTVQPTAPSYLGQFLNYISEF